MALAPVMGRLLRFFPPVVTGTIIVMIGVNLMRVGIGWAMGGPASAAQFRRRMCCGRCWHRLELVCRGGRCGCR